MISCPICNESLQEMEGSPISPHINLYKCKKCGWKKLKCGKISCDGYMDSEKFGSHSEVKRYECTKCGWSCTGDGFE